MLDKCHAVVEATKSCRFARSIVDGQTTLARELIDPDSGMAAEFQMELQGGLPVAWLQSNANNMQLLRHLGMDLKVSPSLMLICAKALHGAAVAAGGVIDKSLQRHSP